MAQVETLHPCPFCGEPGDTISSSGEPIVHNVYDEDKRERFIGCAKCGACGPVHPEWLGAREAWNTRK